MSKVKKNIEHDFDDSVSSNYSESGSEIDELNDGGVLLDDDDDDDDLEDLEEDDDDDIDIEQINKKLETGFSLDTYDDDDDDVDDDDNNLTTVPDNEPIENYLQKINDNIKSNIITEYHPQLKPHNYEEIKLLTQIKRDKNGDINDDFHKTSPFMTKYEKNIGFVQENFIFQ